jgi:putative transcriptional regulator
MEPPPRAFGRPVLSLLTCAILIPLWAGTTAHAQSIFVPVQSKSARNLGPATLLVASRDLEDPNFAKTVILLVHYDAESVLGLIINRHTDVPVARLFDGLKAAKTREDSIYLGGPVEISTVFALLSSPDKLKGAAPVFGEVYLISTKMMLEKTMATGPDPESFHVYMGYAGWTNDQLRKEVALGMWYIFQADADSVFDSNPDSLWLRMIKKTEQTLAAAPLRLDPFAVEHFAFRRALQN